MHVENIHSKSNFSILLLSDKRIITSGINKTSKSISLIDYQTKERNQDFFKESLYSSNTNAFINLNDNKFISCSDDN